MTHNPITCPFCDLAMNGNTGYYPEQFQVHVLAKLAELESRLQRQEWDSTPLGPGPDGNYGQGAVSSLAEATSAVASAMACEEERLNAIRKIIGKQEPECALCYDEEGSWACIRPAHGKMKNA